MKPLFADSFYFVALLNRADQYHNKVASAASQLREDIVTTDWVLMEVADALAESAFRRSVPQFIRDLAADPKVKLVRASKELFEHGLQPYPVESLITVFVHGISESPLVCEASRPLLYP